MAFETALGELTDPSKRPTAQQLVDFSNLDEDEARQLADVWSEIDSSRRAALLSALTDMAQDNVELNFDAVFKTALQDETPEVRAAALRGLFEYEGRDLIPRLIELLREDIDAEVRRECAMALGRYAVEAELGNLRPGDTGAIKEALMECAEDLEEDEKVRARAIEALGAMSGEETDNLIESIYQEESPWLKVGAVDAMGRSANELWLPIVLREMENPAPEMRHAAAFAAGQIGDEEAIGRLKQMAALDPDHDVQLAAITALGEIGGAQARVALKSLLYEGDDDLREAIQEALTEISYSDDLMSPPGL
jgi:HEAT repeat protein